MQMNQTLILTFLDQFDFLRITYLEPEGRFFGLKAFVILVLIELPELGLEPLELELGLEPPLFLASLTSQIEAKITKITQSLTAKRIFLASVNLKIMTSTDYDSSLKRCLSEKPS